ncbi:MAG: hypothetical protein QMD95_00335 [Candidatus Hodarchaeaceae archaeon]|nr:hypothetical protein [Candidatus Hodarchaeaceae archaeon]
MEDASSRQPTPLYYLDAVFAAFILVSGLLVCIIGADYLASIFQMSFRSYYSVSVPTSVIASGFLILSIGIAVVMYGFKRLIGDVMRTMKSNHNARAEVNLE